MNESAALGEGKGVVGRGGGGEVGLAGVAGEFCAKACEAALEAIEKFGVLAGGEKARVSRAAKLGEGVSDEFGGALGIAGAMFVIFGEIFVGGDSGR